MIWRGHARPVNSAVLQNALLPDGRRVDVTVAGGTVAAVAAAGAPVSASPEGEVLDLSGYLLLPAPAEPHEDVLREAIKYGIDRLGGAPHAWPDPLAGTLALP